MVFCMCRALMLIISAAGLRDSSRLTFRGYRSSWVPRQYIGLVAHQGTQGPSPGSSLQRPCEAVECWGPHVRKRRGDRCGTHPRDRHPCLPRPRPLQRVWHRGRRGPPATRGTPSKVPPESHQGACIRHHSREASRHSPLHRVPRRKRSARGDQLRERHVGKRVTLVARGGLARWSQSGGSQLQATCLCLPEDLLDVLQHVVCWTCWGCRIGRYIGGPRQDGGPRSGGPKGLGGRRR